jgi:hypothetical protein
MRFLTRLGMMLLWNSSPSSARNQRQFPRCKRIVQDSHRLGKIAEWEHPIPVLVRTIAQDWWTKRSCSKAHDASIDFRSGSRVRGFFDCPI